MTFPNPNSDVCIPDGKPLPEALARITHLGIGAHQDDLEFMAFHGILKCFDHDQQWFGGVICTNGSGSARTGPYATFTDEQMMAVRRAEQRMAAQIGRYGVMIQLGHPSPTVQDTSNPQLKHDLKQILLKTQPEVVYTHNLADKHDTHIGVLLAALGAMRELAPEQRPQTVIGCEVWRNLDWLPDEHKVCMDVSGRDNLAAALSGVFDSQVAGGKRYDLATVGRRTANATFIESHATDKASQLIFGMDLTPLIRDETLDVVEYVCAFIDQFKEDVSRRLRRQPRET